jgi:hypothetical protein
MRISFPFTNLIFGIIVIVGAFVYDVLFAGIPYQDPTPEMTASYIFHSQVAAVGYVIGLFILLGTVAICISRSVKKYLHNTDGL